MCMYISMRMRMSMYAHTHIDMYTCCCTWTCIFDKCEKYVSAPKKSAPKKAADGCVPCSLSKLQGVPSCITRYFFALISSSLEQCPDAQIVTVLRREDQGGESLRSLLLQIRFRLEQCAEDLLEMV